MRAEGMPDHAVEIRFLHRREIKRIEFEGPARLERPDEPPIARQVPHDRATVGPRAVERATVGRDGQSPDVALVMASESLAELAPLDVPGDHVAVGSRADQCPSVGGETDELDGRLVTAREAPDPSRAQVQQAEAAPGRAQREQPALGADCACDIADGIALEHAQAHRVDGVRRVFLQDGDEQTPAVGGRGQSLRRPAADAQ